MANLKQEPVLDLDGHVVRDARKRVPKPKAQSAQEPPSEWAGIKAILDEYGLQAIDFVADFKAALAQPAQEPVAWQWLGSAHFRKKIPKNADITAWNPLYTAPPKREWVGLTDDETMLLANQTSGQNWGNESHIQRLRKTIENKLKEKNT